MVLHLAPNYEGKITFVENQPIDLTENDIRNSIAIIKDIKCHFHEENELYFSIDLGNEFFELNKSPKKGNHLAHFIFQENELKYIWKGAAGIYCFFDLYKSDPKYHLFGYLCPNDNPDIIAKEFIFYGELSRTEP